MKPIVVVENISKKYSRNANCHLSYGISDLWTEIAGRKHSLNLRKDEFLAVDDISFHLNPGDCFALVGRNGCGKTTMLKMINGVVKPDKGTIIIDGRIQALINLGAGFNAKLSGRDNIYNASALMGLNRKKTNEIIDEILDFAELEDFIDSPIENYSSGMKSRLGFSVAIHLNPDILLIDEILGVGDYSFQNKCFARMQQLKKSGVTIILVSHSHNSVIQLCENAIWMHKGKAMKLGPSKEVVGAYLSFLEELELKKVGTQKKNGAPNPASHEKSNGQKKSKSYDGLFGPIYDEFDKIEELQTSFQVNGAEVDSLKVHDSLTIGYKFHLKQRVDDLNVTLKFFRQDGLNLTTISTLNGDLVKHIHEGIVECRCTIPDFDFNPEAYVLVLAVHEGKSYLYRNVVKEFVMTGYGPLLWGLRDFRYEYSVS